MHFLGSLLAVATLASTALAQAQIAFTQTPSSVTVGVATDIKYSGGDGSPVTINLRKGDPNNLQTIATLTDSATGGDFVWTPDASLVDGTDYALQITQGNQINYSGEFSLSGGSSASASASTSVSIPISNSTMTTTSMASMGTGTSISRNVTFSSATLTSNGGSRGGSTATLTQGGSNAGITGGSGAGSGTGTQATTASASSASTLGSSLLLAIGFISAVLLSN